MLIHDLANDPRLHLRTMPSAHFSTAVLETVHLKGAAVELLGIKKPRWCGGVEWLLYSACTFQWLMSVVDGLAGAWPF